MHIGRGEQLSKTEIMYVPKPSFYQTPADITIEAPPTQNLPAIASPADDTTNDDDAPLTTQNKKNQTTKKTFSTMSQKERETLYDNSPNTRRMMIADGFVDFVKHFKYLGSYVSFDLTDDFDIDKRIAAANKSMGSLKHFWNNPYASLRAKQLIFLAIPANQLLWGCESWALRRSHINKLDVFWHRSIRRILKIGIMQVIEERISNEKIRKIFFNIPTAENTIVVRQMSYLGKIIRGPTTHPPRQMLTAWNTNLRPRGGVLTTNKKALVRSLHTLIPKEMTETITTRNKTTGEYTTKETLNKDGKMELWIKIAEDEELWNWHINKLRTPGLSTPPPNPNRTRRPPPPPPQPNNRPPPPPPPQPQERYSRRRRHPPPPPTPAETPEENHNRRNWNPEGVGRNRTDSLKILNLSMNANDNEIKKRFRRLSLIYHPDRYSPNLGITPGEATAHFQMLNNANEFLRANQD